MFHKGIIWSPWQVSQSSILNTSFLLWFLLPTHVLSLRSVKSIIYRKFSILKFNFIHHILCFYNVWIYSRSYSATKTIRAPCFRKFYFYFPSPLLAYSPLAKPARVPLTQLIPYSHTHTHTHTHTFTVASLLLALMADLCLPLCAGEDTFELHSVQLEAMERLIRELLGKQAQQRNRKQRWKHLGLTLISPG